MHFEVLKSQLVDLNVICQICANLSTWFLSSQTVATRKTCFAIWSEKNESCWLKLKNEFILYFVDTKQVAQISQSSGEETFLFLDKRKMSKVTSFDILNQKKIWLGRNNFDFQYSNFPLKRFWREIWIWIIIVKWYYRWCDAWWHVAKFLNLICQILFWKKDSKIHDWQGV